MPAEVHVEQDAVNESVRLDAMLDASGVEHVRVHQELSRQPRDDLLDHVSGWAGGPGN